MRRVFIMLLCISLLVAFSGCRSKTSPKIETGDTVAQDQTAVTEESIPLDGIVSDVGSDRFEGEFVEIKPQRPPSYGVSFWLPKGWTYSGMQSDDEPTSDLVVNIRPDFPGTEGVIILQHSKGFGICGTGLVQKDIEFNGHPAWQGFYDGRSLWSHIILKDPKDCVILNSAENWYEEYEEEINQILATVEFVYYDNNPSTSGPAEPIIDSASFDIDGDGIIENCTISYGPTSGLYTTVITASVNGNIKYKNTFNLAWGDLSFGEKDGSLYLVRDRHQEGQEPQNEYHKISVEESRIAIDGLDPIYEGYWGGSDWNYNLKDPSPNGNDTASDALPTAESLLTITSDGETIRPFMHFAYSSRWTGAFFINADGTPIEENMTEWAKDTHIPLLRYSDNFSVTYAEGVKLYYIRIFDETGKHPDNFHKAHLTDISQLADVKPGKYYVCLVVNREGAYIPETNSSESTGWDCLFRMIVE